jgi:hypothetical protein
MPACLDIHRPGCGTILTAALWLQAGRRACQTRRGSVGVPRCSNMTAFGTLHLSVAAR